MKRKYIVIVGPDGCGKTTIADALYEFFKPDNKVFRLNFRFGILPPLSTLLGLTQKRHSPEGTPDSGMVIPLNKFHASILGIWYGIDHALGHFKFMGKMRGSVVISARSYHDFFYQRAYKNLPTIIPNFFVMIGPKPNYILTPLRDSKEINDMKPELSSNEIEDQYRRINDNLSCYDYFCLISANNGIADTIDKIKKKIND